MKQEQFKIVLVEDDAAVRDSIAGVLRDEGFEVTTFKDGQEAIDQFVAGADLVIADLMMPRVDGRSLLRWVTQNHTETAVILMTGFGTIPQAVDAIKAGAAAYLTKPLVPDDLLMNVRRTLEDKRLRQELLRLRGQLREGWHYRNIIGKSQAMRQVFSMIDRAAPVKTTVLITGESGTGKELIARAIHEGSPRKAKPFLAINCSAIPENLIESTLFGHEKGSFTGADRDTPGYFQAANGGTLLLDEIGELPIGMQSKLLRVLEDSQVTPVGTTTAHKVDVRIVAATNRKLETEVANGAFREDLFYRLNIVNIRLAPLRERVEDLPLLTRFFLDEICRNNGFEPRQIDPTLLEIFAEYEWPGNIRELRNTLESLVVLSGRSVLTSDDLPDRFFNRGQSALKEVVPVSTPVDVVDHNGDLNLKGLSKQAILKALESCHGNRTEAARHLGISRRTLHRRLNEFGLRD